MGKLAADACRDRAAAPSLPLAAPRRARGDGRHLRRDRRAARTRGRGEVAGRPLRRRRRDPAALQARGAGRRAHLRRARGDHDLRRRRLGEPPVHRHGVPLGRVSGGAAPPRGRAAAGPGARVARTGCDRARRRAPARDRPPRRQAREPAPERPRGGGGRRLRDRERGRPRLDDAHGHRARHGRLPLTRAGDRRTGDACERRLRARGRGVRAAERRAAVRERVADGRGCGARECSGAVDRRALRAPAVRARPRLPAGALEGSSESVRLGPRVRGRAAQRAVSLCRHDGLARASRAVAQVRQGLPAPARLSSLRALSARSSRRS